MDFYLQFQSVSNHSPTENGIKALDSIHRKPDSPYYTNHSNHKRNEEGSRSENHTEPKSSDSPDDITSAQPPPQEFFMRIRGMISAAKNRLNSFRYKPTLLVIPEDDYFYQDFKEKEIEASGNKRTNYKKFSKKGNNTALNKLESIHGSNLGAAMLEAKLAPPMPPPRNAKPKSKKRAPSPPASGEIPLPEYSRETPSPASLKELGGSLDRKASKKVSAKTEYSKFDLFRLDLYEKIHRMRDGTPVDENEVVLDCNEGQKPSKEGKPFSLINSNKVKFVTISSPFTNFINPLPEN